MAEIRPPGESLQLPVRADERTEIGLNAGVPTLLEDPDVPRGLIDAELGGEDEGAVAKRLRLGPDAIHEAGIGTPGAGDEIVSSDEGTRPRHAPFAGRRPPTGNPRAECAPVRPPTWIEEGRLAAGRHPCGSDAAHPADELRRLHELGVTLLVDLTEDGELEPYEHLAAPARRLNFPVRDFTVPSDDRLVEALDAIDEELAEGGVVYVHCWAGCGRTGVVVGCWLVRHGTEPAAALDRIAETRGLGCPQTLEQRLAILGWQRGR